jgi:outer membrane lipopolysaccharide assembly protein LptE/RlpB
MNDFKNYKRKPIILNSHCVMLIHLFKRFDDLEDLWMHDQEAGLMPPELYRDAAKQLIEQLEGQYCDLFIDELNKQIQTIRKERREELKALRRKHGNKKRAI